MHRTRRLVTVFLSTLVAATVMLGIPGIAAAAPTDNDPPLVLDQDADTGPSSAALRADGDGTATMGVNEAGWEVNPAGCLGRTHNPHKSHHDRGTINVVGETYACSRNVTLEIRVVSYRKRWFGWEKRGDSGVKRGVRRSIKTNAGSPACHGETHDWLGVTYHSTYQGKWYTATTSNRQNRLKCHRF